MIYKTSNIHNLITTIGKVLSLLLHTFVDVLKVFLWPIRQLLKDDRYLTSQSILNDMKDIKSRLGGLDNIVEYNHKTVVELSDQINDPLGGIKNIQDEHSRFIQKNAKNRLQCLEDNINMVLNKLKALEDNSLDITSGYFRAFEKDVSAASLSNKKAIRDIKEDIVKLKLKHNNVKSNLVFQLPDDDEIFEQTAKEEYDYHKESKYWDKRAEQAYEDHMSEPQRRHDD